MWWMKNGYWAGDRKRWNYSKGKRSVRLVSNNSRVINSPQRLPKLILTHPLFVLCLEVSFSWCRIFTVGSQSQTSGSDKTAHCASFSKKSGRVFTSLFLINLTPSLQIRVSPPLSMGTLFVFSSVWFDTQQEQRRVLFSGISPNATKVCGLPRAIAAWPWMAELDTIKGTNYNQACNGGLSALFEKELICKKKKGPSGVRGKKKHFDRRHICVWAERLHTCKRGCI